jgi:hypothetical protein
MSIHRGHRIWDIEADIEGNPTIRRIEDEKVATIESDEPDADQYVMLMMGGRQIMARVVAIKDDIVTLTDDDFVMDVPVGWIKEIK